MPQPEGAVLHHNYNPILTTLAQGMLMGLTSEFIARDVFPNLPVALPSGTYTKWKRGDFMRRSAKKLANYEAPPLVGFGSDQGTFSVDRYGQGAMWTAMDLANARAGGVSQAEFERLKLLSVIRPNLLELEIQTAALVQTTGNWAATWAGVASGAGANQFLGFNATASDPVQTIDLAKRRQANAVGFGPNTLILSEDIWYALRQNASLIDRIKYGGTMDRPTQITLDQLKALFEIDRIFIPKSRYNTAKEGAVDALTPVWNNTIWLGYTTPTPSPDQPTAGYLFSWTGNTSVGLPAGVAAGSEGPNNFDSVMNDDGLFVKRFRENRPSGEFVEAELFTTPQVVASELGMTLTNVLP